MKAYLDNNATTPLHPDALAAMLPCFGRDFANPSSSHRAGRTAAGLIEEARKTVADCLCASPGEIVFTSSGSQANNLALKGAAASAGSGNIVTTAVEHPSVASTCGSIGGKFTVTVLPVDRYGLVDPEAVAAAIRPETFLVSVMFANNETGTVMPVGEIGRICREKRVLFHTDAVQAVGKIPVEAGTGGISLLSLSAHKFNGPKGTGVLYVRKGVRLEPAVHGGGQEMGLVGGTSNTAGIVGLAKALRRRILDMQANVERTSALRDRLEKALFSALQGLRLNGHPLMRLPNTLNVGFEDVDASALLEAMDKAGVVVSGGAACHSKGRSPVLEAMGAYDGPETAAVRFSLGPESTADEVDFAAATAIEAVRMLRG